MSTQENISLKLSLKKRTPISVSQENLVTMEPLLANLPAPILCRPAVDGVNLMGWAVNNVEAIKANLTLNAALLFRGFRFAGIPDFERFISLIGGDLLRYSYRSTPRTQVAGNIYTSTEYPADQSIPMHNEMSYSRRWPMKIAFYCVKSAEQGGETPIVDSRRVFERINPNLREKFRQKKVMYVRNYGEGLDISWQEVFNTDDRAAVEQFCREEGIEHEWKDNNRLRTSQVCQAVARHPITHAEVWFNQAHLFHVSSLEPQIRHTLLQTFAQEELPRNVYFGDGSPIEVSELDEIREVYRQESVFFSWHEGDILLLDNMLTGHGRSPFKGERRIVVGMAEAWSDAGS